MSFCAVEIKSMKYSSFKQWTVLIIKYDELPQQAVLALVSINHFTPNDSHWVIPKPFLDEVNLAGGAPVMGFVAWMYLSCHVYRLYIPVSFTYKSYFPCIEDNLYSKRRHFQTKALCFSKYILRQLFRWVGYRTSKYVSSTAYKMVRMYQTSGQICTICLLIDQTLPDLNPVFVSFRLSLI